MKAEHEKMLEEIHGSLVGGRPAEAKLVVAARKVVRARFKSDSWDELKNAIAELAGIVGGDE